MPLLLDGYGARLLVDGAPPLDLAAALRCDLPSQISVTPVDEAFDIDALFEVSPCGPDRFRIEHDGVEVALVEADRLAQTLRTHLELAIALHARSGAFVHAGVVGWRSKAVLVPGPSHAGKSTLVAELVRGGAVYFSDEYAVVDATGRVHAYPRPLRLRQSTVQLLPPHGSEPLAAALIVSTIHRCGARWAPVVRRGASARLPILDNVIVMKERPEMGLEVAARLAPGIVTLSCERPEASQVAPAILQFLDGVLDER